MTSAKERLDFDVVFEEVLNELPPEVSVLLEEVPVIIEDEPPESILEDLGISSQKGKADLCGLHWGTPLPEQSFFETSAPPSRIYLFRGPILRLTGFVAHHLSRQIRITLLHEIGHHFGFDEEKLKSLGYE